MTEFKFIPKDFETEIEDTKKKYMKGLAKSDINFEKVLALLEIAYQLRRIADDLEIKSAYKKNE